MYLPNSWPRIFCAFAASLLFATGANAQATPDETWLIDQIYSNSDGNIQFLVVKATPASQAAIAGFLFNVVHLDAEHAHTPGYTVAYTLPTGLPGAVTPGMQFLIGTQTFADMGIITPDYIVPDQFLPSLGGVIAFTRSPVSVIDQVQYPSLPTAPMVALYRSDAPHTNQAINFAGQTATVPDAPPAGAVGLAVEYYYADWDYYFETSDPAEQAVLDGGAFGGVWQRTGQTFKVWTQGSANTPPVCRLFSTYFAPKSSHFYTPFGLECATVRTNPDWQLEAPNAFFLALTDANGNCGTIGGAQTAPLYRLYNNGMGGAPNHRYTTDLTIFNQMSAAGWVAEGSGSPAVFACVPQ